MPTYPIGQQAATIVTVNIDNRGQILPTVLVRAANGALSQDPAQTVNKESFGDGSVTFSFEVPATHQGSVTEGSVVWDDPYGYSAHILGSSTPFDTDKSEVKARLSGLAPNGANGAVNKIVYHATKQAVTWIYADFTGSFPIGDNYPEVAIAFRLPEKNRGRLAFTSGVSFTQANPAPDQPAQTNMTVFSSP